MLRLKSLSFGKCRVEPRGKTSCFPQNTAGNPGNVPKCPSSVSMDEIQWLLTYKRWNTWTDMKYLANLTSCFAQYLLHMWHKLTCNWLWLNNIQKEKFTTALRSSAWQPCYLVTVHLPTLKSIITGFHTNINILSNLPRFTHGIFYTLI